MFIQLPNSGRALQESGCLQLLLSCSYKEPCELSLLLPGVHTGCACLEDLPHKQEGLLLRWARACQEPIVCLGSLAHSIPQWRLPRLVRTLQLPERLLGQQAHPARLRRYRPCARKHLFRMPPLRAQLLLGLHQSQSKHKCFDDQGLPLHCMGHPSQHSGLSSQVSRLNIFNHAGVSIFVFSDPCLEVVLPGVPMYRTAIADIPQGAEVHHVFQNLTNEPVFEDLGALAKHPR